MEHQQNQPPPQGGVPGPTGRRLHIAHRRSPSELTPLMSMFSSPGSMYLVNPVSSIFLYIHIYIYLCVDANEVVIHSGTTCHSATNRTLATTATADSSYSPAIRQHGHDPSLSTSCPRCIQYPSADAAELICPTTDLPIPKSDATTAADESFYGCTDTTPRTSP